MVTVVTAAASELSKYYKRVIALPPRSSTHTHASWLIICLTTWSSSVFNPYLPQPHCIVLSIAVALLKKKSSRRSRVKHTHNLYTQVWDERAIPKFPHHAHSHTRWRWLVKRARSCARVSLLPTNELIPILNAHQETAAEVIRKKRMRARTHARSELTEVCFTYFSGNQIKLKAKRAFVLLLLLFLLPLRCCCMIGKLLLTTPPCYHYY